MATRAGTKTAPARTSMAARREHPTPSQKKAEEETGVLEQETRVLEAELTMDAKLNKVVDVVEMLAHSTASLASDERLVQLERLVMELSEKRDNQSENGDEAGPVSAPPGTYLDRQQQQLLLTYDAFRTALGRAGAASIVQYRVVRNRGDSRGIGPEPEREGEFDDGGRITIEGPVDAGSSIMIYARGHNGAWGSTGPHHLTEVRLGIWTTDWIRLLPERIDRLEVLDRSRLPVRLGWPAHDDPAQPSPHSTQRIQREDLS